MKLIRAQKISEQYDLPLPTLYKWHSTDKFPGLFYTIGRVLFLDEEQLLRMAKPSGGQKKILHETLLTQYEPRGTG